MDFRTLTYFITVAQELNFSRAAEKLNMSQPPLSNQIQNLEEELGVKLFIRGYRTLSLTEAGNLLLHRSKQILEMAQKTRLDIRHMTNGLSGTLRLSLVEGKPPFIAATWISEFTQEFPNIQYELWNGSSDDVLDQLRKGLSDLGIVAAPFDNESFDSVFVGSEPWVAMIPTTNPLSASFGDEISLINLVNEPLIIPRRKSRVEAIHRWFEQINAEPTILCEQSNYLDALALVEAGVGISIFPQTTQSFYKNVVSKRITDPAKFADYYLVWPRNSQLSSVSEEFVNYVKDTTLLTKPSETISDELML